MKINVHRYREPDKQNKQHQYNIKPTGQDDDLNRFIAEQELFKGLVSETSLPTLQLDISDNDVSGAVDNIADWMEQSGALFMN